MNETNFSLIDLKALSEPITKLIESVRSAVGILYEPTKIRRKAKADADAVVILAKNQANISDIEIRASERLKSREIRRQENIENITKIAIEELPDTVSKDPVDEDWIYEFFDHCQDVRNEQMQSLWGRILAGEVSKPRKFSLRTLNIVKDLSQDDANLFTNFCIFVWDSPGVGLLPLVLDVKNEYMVKATLTFERLQHLNAIGLINFNNSPGYQLDNFSKALFIYFGKPHLVFRTEGKKAHLNIGVTLLTGEGSELAPISGSQASEEYRSYIVELWKKQGLNVNVN